MTKYSGVAGTRTEINRTSVISVGLLLTVCGFVWKSAQTDKQVDFNTGAIVAINVKLDQILAMRTDIEVIRTKVQAMERPVYHTRYDVRHLRREVAQLNQGALVPYFRGPLTMSGR